MALRVISKGDRDGKLTVGFGAAAEERPCGSVSPWKSLMLAQCLDFSITGLLPAVSAPLASIEQDVGRVHRLHHVEVLALAAQLHKLPGYGLLHS